MAHDPVGSREKPGDKSSDLPYRWKIMAGGMLLGLILLPFLFISLVRIIDSIQFWDKVEPIDLVWFLLLSILFSCVFFGGLGYALRRDLGRQVLDVGAMLLFYGAIASAGWLLAIIVNMMPALYATSIPDINTVSFHSVNFSSALIFMLAAGSIVIVAWFVRSMLWKEGVLQAFGHDIPDGKTTRMRSTIQRRMLIFGALIFLFLFLNFSASCGG